MNNAGRNLPRRAGVFLAVLLCLLAACRHTPGKAQIEQAYQHAEAYEWNSVLPLVKQYLIYHPYDAGGHLLLGRCYLEVTPPTLAIADGELQTALALAESGAELGPYAGRMTRDQFIGFIYEKRAKMFMRGYHEGIRMNARSEVLRLQLERSLEQVHRGLAFDPDSPVLQEMEHALLETLAPPEVPPEDFMPPEAPKPREITPTWVAGLPR